MPALLLSITMLAWGNSAYIHAKAVLAQLLIRDSWLTTLSGLQEGAVARPWSWADTWPVAMIRSSHLAQDLYVLAGAHGSSLAFGPGHVDGTALPGESGTTVIAGHRDTHFDFLRDLVVGDQIQIQSKQGRWRDYVVASINITDTSITSSWLIDQTIDEVFFITCYPFDSIDPGGPLRFIVQLKPLV